MSKSLPFIFVALVTACQGVAGGSGGSQPAAYASPFGDACPDDSPASLQMCCDSPWAARYTNIAVEDYACAEECNHHLDNHPEWESLHADLPAFCDVLMPDRSGELWSRYDPPGDEVRFATITEAEPSGACAQSGFDHIDFCFNRDLPPRPSVERHIGSVHTHDPDDGVAAYHVTRYDTGGASDPNRRPAPGDTQVLPFTPHSSDGTLHLSNVHANWPRLLPFRPERVDYDGQTREVAPSGYPGNRNHTYSPLADNAESIHGLVYFDPNNTALDVEDGAQHVRTLKANGFVETLHSTLCESSGAGAGQTTNPIPCRARYGTFPYGSDPVSDNEVLDGLCYRVTWLGAAVGNEPDSESDRTELRSAPLTVFVPSAMTCTAGNSRNSPQRRVWVYPDNPEGTFDSGAANPQLPDFADYDLMRIFPWNFSSDPNIDVREFGTANFVTARNWDTTRPESVAEADRREWDVPARCYEGPPVCTSNGCRPNAAPGAPKWCAFLYNQSRSSTFFFDNDRNATPNRPGNDEWDGRSGADGRLRGARLFELITTGDGNVLVMNNNNGLYYSTNSQGPCEASGFNHFLPISLMPVDPEVADYPMSHADGNAYRDPSGQVIPPGSIGRYAYGWMDRDGRNLFFAAYNEARKTYRVYPQQIERVYVDATNTNEAPPNPQSALEQRAAHLGTGAGHGVVVVGAWTRGKMVLLDNGLNASDLGGRPVFTDGGNYAHRYRLRLYSNGTLNYMPRDVSRIESFENRLNHFDAIRPTAPFDVVWRMQSDNQHNSEVVFDEYMSEQAFVVAHMNASARHDHGRRSDQEASAMEIDDGFVSDTYFDQNADFRFNTDAGHPFGGRVRLQNAAGASPVNTLTVRGGARAEPVALGGVMGRGLFLDGENDHVQFTYPNDGTHDWYLGMFVDMRDFPHRETRAVFHFPDGTWLGIRQDVGRPYYNYSLVAVADGEEIFEIDATTFVRDERYVHLGYRLTEDGSDRRVVIYVNGTRYADFEADRGFDLMPSSCSTCTMTIGAPEVLSSNGEPALGIRAWVDEFRAYRLRDEDGEYSWTEELICNSAYGTLVATDSLPSTPAGERLQALIDLHEDRTGFDPYLFCEQVSFKSHERPTDFAPQHGTRVCADRVHRNGQSEACLRSPMLELPELSPLASRPSSSDNAFCTSCHIAGAATPGLELEAITAGDGARFLDPRRQPMDAPAFVGVPVSATCDGSSDDPWYCDARDAASGHETTHGIPLDFSFDEGDYIEPYGCPGMPGGSPIAPPTSEEEHTRASSGSERYGS